MKHLNGDFYVEVKDHRYIIHPTEKIILRKRNAPTTLELNIKFKKKLRLEKKQKVIKIDNDQLLVKNFPKNKQPIIQQQKFKPPNCPSCKRNNWLEFDKGFFCKNCEYIINKKKHQIDKKVLRQAHDFSTRINYANKKIGEIWMNMVNTNYNSTKDMINKLQQFKGKTKMIFLKNIGSFYHETKKKTFQTQQDPFAKNAQGTNKIYRAVFSLLKFLQTKPQIKNMNIKNYDFYYSVFRIRDENKDIDNQYEDDKNDYIIFNDNITPNHYNGNKPRETILK